MKKRGYNMKLLEEIIEMLVEEKVLPEKNRDHELVGNYIGFRECHIMPDWLLIYAKNTECLTLTASRTGTHSDLL